MSDPISQYYRVLEYVPSLQNVQSMESRDFQYKGIFKLFTCVSEWTDKYLSNKVLPNVEQLAREVGIERDKVEQYINELCFKQNPPLIKKITTVEYDPSDSSKVEMISNVLRRNTVFARPPTLDAGSAQRYVNTSNEGSVAAIKNAISANRVRWTGEKFKDFIFSKISNNKLSDTYASADVANLFNCPYDSTKALKEATVNSHLKPILKKLVDDKILLFFRNEKANKSSNKSIFLYNNTEEIAERIDYYLAYIKSNVIPNFQRISVIGEVSEEDMRSPKKISSLLLPFMDESYGDQKAILEELVILGKFHEDFVEEKNKSEQKEKLQEVIKLLEKSGKLIDMASIRLNGKPLEKEMTPFIISNDQIIYTEYDDGKNLFEFVLHKNNIAQAITNARQLFEVSENDTELRILGRMNILSSVGDSAKNEFLAAELNSLFKYLPFLTRLWRSITGNIYVTKKEADLIRAQKEVEQKKRIAQSKSKLIEKEKQKLIEERMKRHTTPQTAAVEQEQQSQPQMPSFEEELKIKETLKSFTSILDSAWDNDIFPDREYLLSQLNKSMTEEEMIQHLKKNFSKDVFSFQIKAAANSTTKFKWPILITRTYLKRNGRKLLEKAKRESDVERNENAPNQERFDMYSSLESFLEKTLSKL
ncbi:MAG: hypothetical protein H7A24_04355 [Leptospiraceae bacterium]|nr:hypothetical protein [Leptospiraceae bacterium]MCP5511087.1 hypothetical protein [Leptospiraceae bacterium]